MLTRNLNLCRLNQIKNRPVGRFFIWLGWQGSNLRMLVPETSALPLGESPIQVKVYHITLVVAMETAYLKVSGAVSTHTVHVLL